MALFRKHGKADEVVDLRDPAPAPPGPAPLAWGAPAPCPECGGRGYIDKIDIRHDVMHQHCPDCWHRYSITRAEVEASEA